MLSVVCRFWPVREYPWGSCEALSSRHSDLAALKKLLFEVRCSLNLHRKGFLVLAGNLNSPHWCEFLLVIMYSDCVAMP